MYCYDNYDIYTLSLLFDYYKKIGMTDEEFLNDMQGSFKHKFAKKPEVIDGNMKALQLALNQVNLIS